MRGDRGRIGSVLTHVLFIAVLVVLPELLMSVSGRPHSGAMRWGMYVHSAVLLAVFYINYFLIVPRTLGAGTRHRRLAFALLNLALILAAVVFTYGMVEWGWIPGGRRLNRAPDTWHRLLAIASMMMRDAVMLVLVTSLAVAIRMTVYWRNLADRQAKLRAMQRESELEGLRSQLNPHFLFNTLNSIYALIDISPDEARRAVHTLSQLMRYAVYSNPERVSLSRELEFLDHYAELMRLRLGDDRPVDIRVDVSDTSVAVPPLVLVPVVENAFKYGATAPADRPIDIAVTSRPGAVECRTANSFDPARTDAMKGGVGLANLRRRLELLYGGRATLVTAAKGDRYTATLIIPTTA